MTDFHKMKLKISRKAYFELLISMHKTVDGSNLLYRDGPPHHVWKDVYLVDKNGKDIAMVCSTGSVILNHWFISLSEEKIA